MSSRQSDEWTSITVHRSVFNELEAFCNAYGISGKGEGISTLLTIANAAGIPLSLSDQTEVTRELDVHDVSTIQGFLLDDGKSGAALIGTDNRRVTMITDVSEPNSPVQPMARTKITAGSVLCPACGDTVMDYELSESLPGIETGVFNGLEVKCETCGSARPHYTLFVAEPGSSVSADAMANAMSAYFAFILIVESLTDDQFEERINACAALAEDGNWEWLPDPNRWVGFSIEEAGIGPVTPGEYCSFLQSYFRVLLERVDGVRIMELEVLPPARTDEYFDDRWQLHLETRGADPSTGVEDFVNLSNTWETVSVETEMVDADTFADYTVLVTLDGLDEIA